MKETSAVKHIAATTDTWTSKADVLCVSLTAVWVDNEWRLVAKMLETVGLPDILHAAVMLLSKVQESLSRWNIEVHNEIPVIVTNN